MTKKKKLLVRLSEVRERLAAISNEDEVTDELRTEAKELRTEMADLETKYQAALASEPDDGGETRETTEDAETRERRELRGKARVADFIASALTGQGVTGASAEYAEAVGVPGQMPLELLEVEAETETRAVTPGPSSETVTSTRPTVPFAFARTDAAALGIAMPSVSPGEAHFPSLSSSPPAGMKAKDAAADSTAAAFALAKREPGRLTGQFAIRLEDVALLPTMESDLRAAITAQMANQLDEQVIAGDGAAPNLSGLFHQATDVAAAGAAETFATGVSRFAALVDGLHSNGWNNIRALIGTATFAKYAALFQSNGDMSLYDYLAGKLGALRVSTRVPAVASNAQKGLVVLGAQGRPITVPVWRAVQFIVDPYTQAGKGQRVVTAVSLIGSPFVPYGNAQVKELHPKLSA